MAKVKAKWHKRLVGSGLQHAVRDGQDTTVCGVKVGEDWSGPLARATKKCKKCADWEPAGIGPGGWASSLRRKKTDG